MESFFTIFMQRFITIPGLWYYNYKFISYLLISYLAVLSLGDDRILEY